MDNLSVLQSKSSLFSRFKDSRCFDLLVFTRSLFLYLAVHPRDLIKFFCFCFLAIFRDFHSFVLIFVYLFGFVFFVRFLFNFLF